MLYPMLKGYFGVQVTLFTFENAHQKMSEKWPFCQLIGLKVNTEIPEAEMVCNWDQKIKNIINLIFNS